MDLSNENQAREAIEEWKSLAPGAQLRLIREGIETVELNRAYYEQKGSEKAAQRAGRIIEILAGRRKEIEASQP
jgi:hypothetical protein